MKRDATSEQLERPARFFQCQGEHLAGTGDFHGIYYCTSAMGHKDKHRDIAGRRWSKLFIATLRCS